MKSWSELSIRSYTPYSRTNQGCIVRGDTGILYPGIRIENASFPLSITASQSGIFSCISEGDNPVEIYFEEDPVDECLDYLAKFHDLKILVGDPIPQGSFKDQTELIQPSHKTLSELTSRCVINESDFPVACILKSTDGKCATGVNIEYPNWQVGLCAERVAISKALSNGWMDFDTMHIYAKKGEFISPCGACRQVMVEHMPYRLVVLYHPDGTMSEHSVASLLPAFFNGQSVRSTK